MKTIYTVVAVVASLAFTAPIVLANPAMMKKHEGYPSDDGKGTTATGAAAAEKAAADAPRELRDQLKEAGTNADRAGNTFTDDPRQRKHPGYPDHGVTEDMIKDATKVNADPK